MTSDSNRTTLEWFGSCKSPQFSKCDSYQRCLGATTFRLRTKGLTIFLDTWLERPSIMPKYLAIEDVQECDYIFISHAHFDQYVLIEPQHVHIIY